MGEREKEMTFYYPVMIDDSGHLAALNRKPGGFTCLTVNKKRSQIFEVLFNAADHTLVSDAHNNSQ